MLHASSISSNGVGIRISSVARMVTSPTAKIILLFEAIFVFDKLVDAGLSEAAISNPYFKL
jgi:hypothetical protein